MRTLFGRISLLGLAALLAVSLPPLAPRGLSAGEAAPAAGAGVEIHVGHRGAPPVFLDMAAIRNLPAVTFTTYDPWDKRSRTYKGPLITDVLDRAGAPASASQIEIVASNDYRIPIKVSDLRAIGHILSYEMDGIAYAEHEAKYRKGPLAVAIDFATPDIDMDIYKHQLAWWVVHIDVE